MTLPALRQCYLEGRLRVRDVVAALLARQAEFEDHGIWIYRPEPDRVLARADELDRLGPETLPLYGIPFVVKDNIDVAGWPTTAAYPRALYTAEQDAYVVGRLLQAGAVLLGKTNLDQFATGLNGTRSPYGVCVNAFDRRYISGGSSSGSAVAVAANLASFALGTDTAGSGRVPAAFNNLVGVKPSGGLLSTRGVVPACRSLDCVSVFALTVEDGLAVTRLAAGYDADDPFARAGAVNLTLYAAPERFRFAVPAMERLQFFGNDEGSRLFAAAVERLRMLGGVDVAVDFEAFLQTAQLLYQGPWVSERAWAIASLLGTQDGDLLPVIRRIVETASGFSAADAFSAYYRLKALKRRIEPLWRDVDFLLTPTAPTIYRIEDVQADPIELNNALGYYTNFVNLLGLCALAVPAGFQGDGLPFGVTLIAPNGGDARLAAYGAQFQAAHGVPLGSTRESAPPHRFDPAPREYVDLFVCGAHMGGLALNHELLQRGARFVAECATSPCYRLYALEQFAPARPGLIRGEEGQAIQGELWRVPLKEFGGFVVAIPPPLAIGSVQLGDGGWTTGFVCEGHAAKQGRDISDLGSWRVYLQRQSASQPRT